MTVQQLLEAHIKNIKQELASQKEEVRIVQQQLKEQLLPHPLAGGLAWGPRLSC